jgi:hypothetical protein
MTLAPDTEMLEYICNESQNTRPHLVGTESDDRKRAVRVAPEILTKYAGSYQMGPRIIVIALEQGELVLDMEGIGKMPLIPLSESAFTASGACGVRQGRRRRCYPFGPAVCGG